MRHTARLSTIWVWPSKDFWKGSSFVKESYLGRYRLASLEKITAVLAMVFGVWMRVYLAGTTWMTNAKSSINNPAFYPSLASYGFIIIGALLFAMSFRTEREKTVTINWLGFAIAGIWFVFAVLCQYVGFILAGIAALLVSFVLWGAKSKKAIVLTGILAPVVIYLILGVAMGVDFPTLFL